MRRAAAITAVLIAAGAAAQVAAPRTSTAQEHHAARGPAIPVSIGYANYAPARLDVVVGDSVRWTNDSVRRHTVTDDAGRFDSGSLIGGAEFEWHFATEGAFPYHCRLHAGITGEVDVHKLLLESPEGAAAADRPFFLRGRTALVAGTTVAVQEDAGDGYRQVAETQVDNEGRIAVSVAPHTTAQYRAVADGAQSPPVQLLVVDHRVGASARRRGRTVTVRAEVSPPAPGSVVVLQLRLRERFGWWPLRSAKLNKSSRGVFRVRLRRPVRARVALTLADRATVLAVSPAFRIPR
jgi:plastocyanin